MSKQAVDPGAADAVSVRRAPTWRVGVPGLLLLLGAAGWAWSAVMAGRMSPGSMGGRMATTSMDSMMGSTATDTMSFAGFMLAWLAMMAAMMLPAIIPVVRLYGLGAARGTAAPLPFFVTGYLVIWVAIGVPGYLAWRALGDPLANGESWTGYLAAGVLLAAAIYQLTPLKSACLRHCRSPLGFFMRQRGDLRSPWVSLRTGMSHGLVCLGCCWALMAVLVALGTMQIGAMLAVALLILVEKNAPAGLRVARAVPVAMGAAAAALIVHPSLISHLG